MQSRVVSSMLGESDDSLYTTTLHKVSLYGAGDLDVIESQATVVWDLTWEGRSWGVKDLDVTLHRISVTARTSTIDTQQESDFNVDWSIDTDNGWKVKVDKEAKSFPMNVQPLEVNVVLQDKTIEVIF